MPLLETGPSTPSLEEIRKLPLVEVSLKYGTDALRRLFFDSIAQVGLDDNPTVLDAARLAPRLHEGQKRSYEPHVNHLYRVALRYIELVEEPDPNEVATCLMHDSVEDQAKRLARLTGEHVPKDKELRRQLAHRGLVLCLNPIVADSVLGVTNPLLPPGISKIEKRAHYRGNIMGTMIYGTPGQRIKRLPDFLDNAANIPPEGHEDPAKRRQLDKKQIGLYGVMAAELSRPDTLVAADMREQVAWLLAEGHRQAKLRLESSDESPHPPLPHPRYPAQTDGID